MLPFFVEVWPNSHRMLCSLSMTHNMSPAVICLRTYHWSVKLAYVKICDEMLLWLLLIHGLHPLCLLCHGFSKHIHVCMISKFFPKLQNNLCSIEAKLSIFYSEVSYPFLVFPWIKLAFLMNILYHPHFNWWILFHLLLLLGTFIILRFKILAKLLCFGLVGFFIKKKKVWFMRVYICNITLK